MKNKQIINPIGLKGNEIHERQLSLMGIKPINENENKTKYSVELTKIGPDGNAYAIIRENHEYYIKRTNKTTGLVLEDFKYIGGLQNKKDEAYPSYAKAIKQLNLKFKSLAESYNRGGDINVFEDDNLLSEHHPYKADQKLSATKGMGDSQEYVVNKKGKELSYDAKEGKEKGQFGDNLADGKACDDCEEVKVNEGFAGFSEMKGNGFTGEGNLHGNKKMSYLGDDIEECGSGYMEEELSETEAAIEAMLQRDSELNEEGEEMSDRDKELAAMKPPFDEITQADVLAARGVKFEEESIEEAIKRLDALLEGELKKKALK